MLAELLLSVADAVISYTVDKLDPAERIKSWLKRDPVTLAFQKSLARTYSAFARQYPDYANSLFDETFLTGKAVPELSKLLIRNQHPDPALLAQAWGKSLGTSAEFSHRATKPASDFLLWLEAELKSEPALQPLFDSRALDNIDVGIENLTKELRRGLEAALQAANTYQQATIHIGGDVKGDGIIIGNNNQLTINKYDYSTNYFYTGDFVSLNEYYIPPDGVFQRVDVDKFVGRDWLTAKVDAFLNDPKRKSGAFLLIGDAGVGKTAFMAHLVKERRYLHLFAEQAPGQAMLQRALQSLGSQLVTRYQIDPYKDRDTLTQLAVFPDFLERLLRLAASTLTNGEKIVIVCDALDEAGVFPDHFVFGLPKELPDGVYFILSQRPVNVKLPNFEPVIEKLEAQGEGNLQDIEAYLSAVAKRPEVMGQIRSKEYSEDFFIHTLKEKSQGVWMFLHYIIKEIESGARAPLDLANLPTGLVGYYAEYWDAWRTGKVGKGEEAWDELYAPLLTTLATAQEAITAETLIQWADVTAKPREVTRFLNEPWSAFITEKEKDGKKTYTPYHLSFKDFITGRVDTVKLQPAQANLVKDLAAQTVDAHKRIVNTFEKECSGEWEKLVEQDYPRLHLSAHLAGAGEYDELRILLTEGDGQIKWAEAREKKEETYAGYLNDLTYIWDYSEREQYYALAIRCMLIENSIHSLASNIPPELLAELAKAGIWSYARCLSIIRQKLESQDQAESLNLIAPGIPIPSLLFQEALSIACEIKEENWRATTFSVLAPYMPNELKTQMLVAVSEIKDESSRANALTDLIPLLPEELKRQALQDALATALEINLEETRASALSALMPLLPDELKTQTLQDALFDTLIEIYFTSDRIRALSALAPFLPDKLKTEAFEAALVDVYGIEGESERANALTNLALLLPDRFKAQLLQEALAAAREIKDKSKRVGALTELVLLLSDKLKTQLLQEALAVAGEIEYESTRTSVLSVLFPILPNNLKAQAFQDALATAYRIERESARANALANLAPLLPDKLKTQALQDGLAAAYRIERESALARADALTNLAPHLSGELKTQTLQDAMAAVYGIERESARAKALTNLAPHLSGELKTQALQEALLVVRKINVDDIPMIESDSARVSILSILAPHMSDEFKKQVLDAAREIKNDSVRASILIGLASHLTDELKAQVLQETFAAALKIEYEDIRANILIKLVPLLSNELIIRALDAAREIKNDSARASILIDLASHLTDELKEQVLQETFAAALKIEKEDVRVNILIKLVPLLSNELIIRVLDAAREIKYDSARANALTNLVPHLSSELKTQVLQAALAAAYEIIGADYSERARALSAIAPHLSAELKTQVLQDALDAAYGIINLDSERARALSAIAPHLSTELKTQVLQHALSAARSITEEDERASALSDLVPYFDIEIQITILQESIYISDPYALNQIIKRWQKINFEKMDKYLIPFIKFLSQKDRGNGVQAIGALTPALVHFRGPEIVPELYRAIQDTARWWP